MAVINELKDIIASTLSVDPATITPESHFINDLGADSLDLADLIMKIEEKYEIDFANEDTDQFQTVGAVAEAIKRLQG